MNNDRDNNSTEYSHQPDHILLSIIIPVFNVEQYIDQCLTSVFQCDLRDSEVILSIGDSSDNSNLRCFYYQKQYPNVFIIRQDGKGLSDARNSAMKIARGRYIAFIDSDDYILPDAFDAYIHDLREGKLDADLIVTDFFRIERADGCILNFFQIGEHTPIRCGMEYLPEMLKKRECFWNVWRFIYRRSFLEENSLTFLVNFLSEDIDFITRVIVAKPAVIFSHRPYYFYAIRQTGSLMRNKDFSFLHDTVCVLKESIERMRQSGLPYAGAVIAQYQYEYILSLAIPSELPKDEQAKAYALFQDYKSVLSPSQDKVVTVALFYMKVFGLHHTSHLLHSLKQLRRQYRIMNKKA